MNVNYLNSEVIFFPFLKCLVKKKKWGRESNKEKEKRKILTKRNKAQMMTCLTLFGSQKGLFVEVGTFQHLTDPPTGFL